MNNTWTFSIVLSLLAGWLIMSLNLELLNLHPLQCETNFSCASLYLSGPVSSQNEELAAMMKEKYFVPPPKEPVRTTNSTFYPVWKRVFEWNIMQKHIKDLFKTQPSGFFVEVGAVDGELMSQTLFLERNLGWTGLLIEPDPRLFLLLKTKKRNAWLSPICIYNGYPSQRKFWLRRLEKELPRHLSLFLMSRSKLATDILEGDENWGPFAWVPCAPLSSQLNALQVSHVDFLSLNIGTDDDRLKIYDVIKGNSFTIKFLLLFYTTSRIYTDPFPQIHGYLLDAKRSVSLGKLYVRKSLCQLVAKDTCEKVPNSSKHFACFTYLCSGNFIVQTF